MKKAEIKNVKPMLQQHNVIRCANIADELLKLYPDGLVLGSCRGIVGQFGLVINWNSLDGTKEQKRYKEDEELPITEVKGQMFVLSMFTPNAIVHSRFFKGFVRRSV